MAPVHAELAKFALVLQGCKPQTSSVERLFKEHAGQQTEARNRMGPATLRQVTTVQSADDQEERRSYQRAYKSRNRVLAAKERVKSTTEQF